MILFYLSFIEPFEAWICFFNCEFLVICLEVKVFSKGIMLEITIKIELFLI